jgi:hypothetical protein
MLAATLLILAENTNMLASADAENPAVAGPAPQAEDIRFALANNRIKISSSGMMIHDFAIRNIVCDAMPLADEYQQAKPDNPFIIADTALSQAKCSYEFAVIPLKNKPSDKISSFRKPAKPISAKEIRRIKENRWMTNERQFVRFNRKVCLMMSRTPMPGEYDDYWEVVL